MYITVKRIKTNIDGKLTNAYLVSNNYVFDSAILTKKADAMTVAKKWEEAVQIAVKALEEKE